MMEKLFSIGAVSELLGITKQTLHYYDKIGLVKPSSIDSQTGYRYYEYDQFHYIDRIKYLQSFGLSLKEIEDVLKNGEVDELLTCLRNQSSVLEEQLQKLKKQKSNLDWYIRYYEYLHSDRYSSVPFKRVIPPRYALVVPCYQNEPIRASGPIRLAKARNSGIFSENDFLRQNGFVLNYSALMEHCVQPEGYYIYLNEKPAFNSPLVKEFPAGVYLCFCGQLLADNWDISIIKTLMDGQPIPSLIVADEYEDNLKKFTQCMYEIQFLIEESEQ